MYTETENYFDPKNITNKEDFSSPFLSQTLDLLECGICKKIIKFNKQIFQCDICWRFFCENGCSTQAETLTCKDKTPHTLSINKSYSIFSQVLSKIQFRCFYNCGKTKNYAKLEKHLKKCCKMVVCKYCNIQIYKEEYEEHLKKCEDSLVKCKLCNKEVKIGDIDRNMVCKTKEDFDELVRNVKKFEKIQDELEENADKIVNLNKKLKETRFEYLKIENENENLKARFQRLQDLYDKLDKKCVEKDGIIENLHKKHQEMSKIVSQKEEEIKGAQSNLALEEKKVVELEKKVQNTEELLKKSEEDKQLMKKEFDLEKFQYEEKIIRLKQEIEELKLLVDEKMRKLRF